MADNVTLNAMTGGDVVAADDIGSVKYQRVKVTWGADGVATDVDAGNSSLPVNPTPANVIGNANQTVVTAGTAVNLPNLPCVSITIRANPANTGTVYIGTSGVTASTGIPLVPGEAISLDITNANLIWVNADTNADRVKYLWVNVT